MPETSPHGQTPTAESALQEHTTVTGQSLITKIAKPLDAQESSIEDMARFLRRQPIKHYFWFLGVIFAGATTIFGLAWFVAATKVELTNAQKVGELSAQIAGLKAELQGADQTGLFLREELRAKAGEYERAQQLIQSLQTLMTEKDRKLVAAQGCETIRHEFRRLVSRATELSKKIPSADLNLKEVMQAEMRVLDGTVTILKGSLDGCASR